MLVQPVKFKLEGKETDIIREFSNGDNKYLEKKIIIDKQGNTIKEKNIDNNMRWYQLEKYLFELQKQGYKEI